MGPMEIGADREYGNFNLKRYLGQQKTKCQRPTLIRNRSVYGLQGQRENSMYASCVMFRSSSRREKD